MNICLPALNTLTVYVHQSEFEEKEQNIISGLHRAVAAGMPSIWKQIWHCRGRWKRYAKNRGTAGRIFSALAHNHVNVKMIDQGSSELNIIIGVENRDFETAIRAIYDIFVTAQL